MKIILHPKFEKSYRTRIVYNKKLAVKVTKRIALFKENPHHPLLKDHQLTGNKIDYRAFSVTGDIRIVYTNLP